MAEQDILENNYTVHGVDSINQLHQNCAYVSFRESKQKAHRITSQNQPQYQTKNHNTKKYNVKIHVRLLSIQEDSSTGRSVEEP